MKKIWHNIKNQLGFVEEGPADDENAIAFAATALLVEMCQADLEEHPDELVAIRRALRATFKLSTTDIDTLLERAHRHQDKAVSYYPHVTMINQELGQREKREIVTQLWRVALADGRLDKYEEHYLRRLCELIHVPHRVFIQTKHEVTGEGA